MDGGVARPGKGEGYWIRGTEGRIGFGLFGAEQVQHECKDCKRWL